VRLVPASLAILAAVCAGCADPYAGTGVLEAEKAMLERELEGLHESADRLNRGEPIFPASDVLIAIDEAFVQGLVTARLPIEVTSGPYTVTLSHADVGFSGSPTVRLRGTITREGVVTLEASVALIGALAGIEIDPATSTLRSVITADHLDIERVAGIEAIFSGSSLDDVARLLRQAIAEQLPVIEIPVRVQEDINLPPVTDGPVRLSAARLPIKAVVSRVIAAERRLWIALHVEIGQLGKVTP
jgi:hypothetical protein